MPFFPLAFLLQAGAVETAVPVFPADTCLTEARLAVYMRDAARYGGKYLDRMMIEHGAATMCDGRSVASYAAVLRQGNPGGKLPAVTPRAVIAPTPAPKMATFTTNDAPFAFRFNNRSGRVVHHLTINGFGLVEECAANFPKDGITEKALKLAQASCQALFDSGEFTPPLAADKKATVAQLTYAVDWKPVPYPAAVRPPAARGNPGGWVTPDDYPAEARTLGQQGRVGFQLVVGPTGRVERCTITLSSQSPTLDAGTCRLVSRRARFAAAVDGVGQPTVGYYEKSVTWVMP